MDILHKNWLRGVVYSILLMLVVVFIVPCIMFFHWFDAKRVEQAVTQQFNNANYVVKIEGGVSPQFWDGLALHITGLDIKDQNGNHVLYANDIYYRLSWLDVLLATYKVRSIDIDGISLYNQGIKEVNFSELFNLSKTSSTEFNQLDSIKIYNVSLYDENENVLLAKGVLELSNLVNKTPEFHLSFATGKEIPWEWDVHASNSHLTNNSVIFDKIITQIQMSDDSAAELHSTGEYQLDSRQFWINNMQGSFNYEQHKGELNIDNVLLSTLGVSLNNPSIKMQSGSTSDSFVSSSSQKVISRNFRDYSIENLHINHHVDNLDFIMDTNTSINQIDFDEKLLLNANQCQVNYKVLNKHSGRSVMANLRGPCGYDFGKNTGASHLSGVISGKPANFDISVNNQLDRIKYSIKSNISELDLADIVASKKTSNDAVTSFDNKLNNIIPVEWMRNVDFSLLLNIKNIQTKGAVINNVALDAIKESDVLKINQISANMFGGNAKARANIELYKESGFDLSAKTNVENVDAKGLLSWLFDVSAVEGVININADIKSPAIKYYSGIQQFLSGSIDISVNKGRFSGVDFSLLANPEALAGFTNKASQTVFSNLSSRLNFVNGISRTGNIMFKNQLLDAKGSGVVNLNANQLDYVLSVKTVLPENEEKIKSAIIPVEVKGNLFSPKISIKQVKLNERK